MQAKAEFSEAGGTGLSPTSTPQWAWKEHSGPEPPGRSSTSRCAVPSERIGVGWALAVQH